MGGAIVMLLIFPLINIAETRSPIFRPLYKFFVMFFLSNFLLLGYLGQSSTDYPFGFVGQCSTLYYFLFLTVIVLGLGVVEKMLTTNE
jgi:quinol-cytochrome oxidoreductase complex cytochrome b subunit